MKQIPFGSTVVLRATFADAETDEPVDPAVVQVKLRPRKIPSGMTEQQVTEVFAYGTDPELVRVSAGNYKLVWVPPAPGGWLYEWEANGAARGVAPGSFLLTPSSF